MAADRTPGFQGTAPTAPSPTFQARGTRDRPLVALESVIGTDDRVEVPDPQNAPWRMVCALNIVAQNGGTLPGTGWLAGPRTVITAGHCVFDPATLLGFALSIDVTPGRNGASMPFGQVTATRFRTLQPWFDSQDPDFDIGAISLDTNLGNQVGFFPAEARPAGELQEHLAHISGYPRNPGHGVAQFHHRNRITSLTDRRLFYDVDTSEGQSGAPVWVLDVDGGSPIVVGVHTYGDERTPPALQPANSATLVNPAILAQIRAWIAEDST